MSEGFRHGYEGQEFFFSTSRFLVSIIYQNHLDTLQGAFDSFCKDSKNYEWGIIAYSKKAKKEIEYSSSNESDIESQLVEAELKKVKYYVKKLNTKTMLIVSIEDGISVSIKHGTYELYGLYNLICDLCTSMSSPSSFVFLRKHWLSFLFVSILIIPALTLSLFNLGWIVLIWVPLCIIAEFLIAMSLLDNNDWDDYVLKTDIKYGEYGTKTINIFQSAFGSIKGTISLLASLATVVTFIIYMSS